MTDMQPIVISPDPRGLANTQKRSHPRRTSPEQSKSLPRHKRQKLNHDIQDAKAQIKGPSIAQLPQSISQGSGSDRSASHWFDKVNKNVSNNHSQEKTHNDDEPPFFLSNQVSYFPNNFVSSGSDDAFGLQPRDDSENEDLRGVIDDLTVENKRLKHLLRNQRTRPSREADGNDKLFEVRMHGLPAEKKRELEHMLKNFATNLHINASSLSASSATGGSKVSSAVGQVKASHKGLQTDSGYGSNSISENASATRSNGGRPTLPIPKRNRDRTIKNYLHDMPETLVPRPSPVMSEGARMALVVRRLEQLFTGKNAAPGEHSQPLQQQEVSQSAARADRIEDVKLSRKRQLEGTREAHIIPYDSKINFDAIDVHENSPLQKSPVAVLKVDTREATKTSNASTSGSGSPDQRPTRPLDLDIHRAQVAEENIEYIRHLGLSSPHLAPDAESAEDKWIYLNLLISMAQLHTINVTPGFIRKALEKLSTKFELSRDGHKVRWRGGLEGTVFSRDEERAMEVQHDSSADSTDEAGRNSSRHSKTGSSSNAITSTTPSDDKTSGLQTSHASKPQTSTEPTTLPAFKSKPYSAFDYQPILFKGKHYRPEESYLDSPTSYESGSGDSNDLVHSLSKSNLSSKSKHPSDEGTLTFFNNPFFFSDLGGDTSPVNWKPAKAAEGISLGACEEQELEESPLRHHDACFFTPQFARAPYRPGPNEAKLDFVPTALEHAGEGETQPMELTVSGLGGVVPEDNFAVDVKVVRTKRSQAVRSMADKKNAVTGRRISPRFAYRLLRCERLELRPTPLPPPSYMFFTSSESGELEYIDDSSEDSESSSEADEEVPAPPRLLNQFSSGSSHSSDSDGEEVDDNESVDMLQAARAADPERVAAQEREYLLNQPGGARAVAGSLVVTVGTQQDSSDEDCDDDLRSDVDEVGSDMDMDE